MAVLHFVLSPRSDQAALLPFDAGIDCIRTFARLP